MKFKFIYILCLLLGAYIGSYSQSMTVKPNALTQEVDSTKYSLSKGLVKDYFQIITGKKTIDSLTFICEVPFAWFGDKILDTWSEIITEHRKILDITKNYRRINVDRIYLTSIQNKIIDEVIPIYVYTLTAELSWEENGRAQFSKTNFAVKINDFPKIIGVSGD